jgi:catalase (peroxidase I)
VNKGLDAVLAALQPIKDQFGEGLSWADLIVLAGGVGLEQVSLYI